MFKSNLVIAHGEKLTTTSLIIAENCPIEKKGIEQTRTHESVLKLIRKYQIEFESLGFLGFKIQEKRGTQGAATEYIELNEAQATFLITLFQNTKLVVAFKLKLVKDFEAMKKIIASQKEQRLTVEWQQARLAGKQQRKDLAAAISRLEQLANDQGGIKLDKKNNPTTRNYHATITKMIYKQLFGDSSLKNFRDQLDSLKLQFLDICELACTEEIERLTDLGIDYHDIYSECKKRVIVVTESLSKTGLIGKDNVVKLSWQNHNA